MANRTVKDATYVKGTNPQYLIEKIIRARIYDSRYWKEECFALSAELVVDKAMELKYVGGIFAGNVKPTPFLCLVLKLLQIQPQKDIIVEFIKNEEFKYVRLLGAYYMRLVGSSVDIYKYLEPLYNDFRKLRFKNTDGRYELMHVDEFIDQLLLEERVCSVQLPRLQKREVLEDGEDLDPRVSALDDDLDDLDSDESDEVEDPELLIKEVQKQESKLAAKNDAARDGYRPADNRPHRSQRSPSPYRDRRRHEEVRGGRAHEHDKRRYEEESRTRRRERSRTPDRQRRRGAVEEDHRRQQHSKHSSSSAKDHRSSHRDRDRNRERDRDNRDRERDRDRSGKKRRHGGDSAESEEIRQANELRARLGMAPLRP